VTTIGELRTLLLEVPDVLIDVDDTRVLTDAITSLDALEGIDVVPSVIAFVGSSGSGKSALVNAVLGVDVAETGVLRPTTLRPLMVGGSGPVSLSAESEYLHLPDARPGILVIDTPAWEHDPEAVRSVVAAADLVVVVVTPSRYADASVAELIDAIPSGQPSAVVVNRVVASGEERDALLASVTAAHGSEVVVIDEGGSVDSAAVALLDGMAVDTLGYERAAVFRSAAASGARHIAGALTAAAIDIGSVSAAIDTFEDADFSSTIFTVFDAWPPTRADLARTVARRVHDTDALVMDRAANPLARRLHAFMGRWEGEGDLSVDLDAWRTATVDRFADASTIRWRRRAAIDQIDRFSWRVAINTDSPLPPRMTRMLGNRLQPTVDDARGELLSVMARPVDRRLAVWAGHLDRLSAYAPGELLAAADGFAPGVPPR
jgi:energy-coupling factor transporter ATP-binding protein EcfA2